MFQLAEPSLWLDSLRVPSAVGDGVAGCARWTATGRALRWEPARAGGPLKRYSLGPVTIFSSRLRPDKPTGAGWEPIAALSDGEQECAFVWRSDDGIFLPFDPDEAVLALLSEAYVRTDASPIADHAKAVARKAYYRARPLMPRRLQLTMRRAFTRVQARQRFPRWPAETTLHDLYDRLLGFAADVAGEPLPQLAPWPKPFSWALVLTHDVETTTGYRNVERICELERKYGYRSSWNLVPRRDYTVEDTRVAELQQSGWEVGVHGLHHDGRDLESEQLVAARLPEMRKWADRWGARGFRAPATQRRWDLMPRLGFDYDSSYPDTDPFEPQGGGCCSWLPFWNGDLLELPITLAQDHTLFVILRESGARLWLEKARLLREREGMALLDTHPDYLLDEPATSAYEELLATFAEDATAWRALPVDVATWWHRRAETHIERDGTGWRAVGPGADEALISYAEPAQAA
jgi:peptidoglycan/xylan/chitin deacetylase (PgdA/CDA1 family)